MSSVPLIPKQAVIAIADMLDNCAKVQPDMDVLIVAANDGLYGGINIVDQETVAWVQAGVSQWRVPPVVANAMRAADVVISHAVDLTYDCLLYTSDASD